MSLEKLRKEIKRLKSIDGSVSSFSYQKLSAMKEMAEAIDEWMFFDHLNQDFKEQWKEIKLILNCDIQ